MKKRHLPLLALSALGCMLMSCGARSYIGTYEFQMGKNSGAHALARIQLFNEDFSSGDKILGKKMSLFGEVSAGPKNSDASTSAEPGILDALANGVEMAGYYNITPELNSEREQLQIGFSLDQIGNVSTSDSEEPVDISHEVIEKFIFGEIDASKIYLQVPVSFTDLQMQLYWYGADLPFLHALDGNSNFLSGLLSVLTDEEEPAPAVSSSAPSVSSDVSSSSEPAQSAISAEPGAQSSSSGETSVEPEITEHAAGTKPTQDDIDKINETYPASHNGMMFRTFYTVSLALSRQ